MFSKLLKQILKHKFATGIVLLVVIGGYLGYQNLPRDNIGIQYVTAEVQQGTIIFSVSGSGQIDVSDQIDIKPKVSGKITAVYVKKGQDIKKGALLASLNSRDAQRAVSDAEISLESAKIKLDELFAGADAQSLLQAENALAQAERDLEKAKANYENIEADSESTLVSSYEDGYNDVSTSFFKLSDYMKDLKDVIGTDQRSQKYITGYELILGKDSLFIQKLLVDYDLALNLFNKNFAFFITVFRDDDRDTIYQLISDTLETTKAISRALENARHMYDAAVLNESYRRLNIASQIDKMQPKIESDLSSVFSTISSLQRTIDTIDDTIQDTPDKIIDAELTLKSAQEKLGDKKLSLEELKAGADPLDIRTQQNIVAQRESALSDAKEKLVNHFVRAPFDGVFAEVIVKLGDSVSSGTTLATLMTQQQIAELALNEIDIAKVKLNQPVTLTFDAVAELTLTGKVTDIASTAFTNQGVVTYGVTITLDTINELIKPGMTVDASIITERKDGVVLVPNVAVQTQGGQTFVEIMQNDVPQLVPVEVGLSNELTTEIISGLESGVQVVTARLGGEGSSQTANVNQSLRIPGLGGGGGGFRGGGGGGFLPH